MVGTSKGALLRYDLATLERKECLIKRRKLICGEWDHRNTFVYTTEDRSIIVCDSSERGALHEVNELKLRSRPSQVRFGGCDEHPIISSNLEGRAILIYDLSSQDTLEFTFSRRYGKIATYAWLNQSVLSVAFETGYVVGVSSRPEENGRETFCIRPLVSERLRDIVVCSSFGVIAVCGDKTIKIFDLTSLVEVCSRLVERNIENLETIEWVSNLQNLSVR
jgi:WD40 repeat protein